MTVSIIFRTKNVTAAEILCLCGCMQKYIRFFVIITHICLRNRGGDVRFRRICKISEFCDYSGYDLKQVCEYLGKANKEYRERYEEVVACF